MKKFIKMSMVTAVTLAGISSCSSASTLAEVADNFEVFGYAHVRYDSSNDGTTDSDSYTHKEVIGATGKLTDNLSYMFAGANLEIDNTDKGIGYSNLLMVYNYFTYTGIENTSISVGRQGLDSPLTVVYDPATATSEANGGSITTKLGNTNINAAYFANTNFDLGDQASAFPGNKITGGESYGHIGVTTKAGPVSIDAWFASMQDRYKSYTVGVNTELEIGKATLSPYARYTAADIDGVNADQSLWKAGAEVKVGIFGANLDYGQTNEEGGWVTFDDDAEVNLEGWKVGLLGNADAKLLNAGVNVDVLSNLNFAVSYADLELTNSDQKEIYSSLTYKITKGITAQVKYSQVDDSTKVDKEESTRASLLWLF